jgi:anti-anti-sigma regulatory factor
MAHPVSSRSPLELVVTSVGSGRPRVAVSGGLDARSVGELVRRLQVLLAGQHPAAIRLDLSAVPSVDPAAAEALRRMHGVAAAAGCDLTVEDANEATWWLFGTLTPSGRSRAGG